VRLPLSADTRCLVTVCRDCCCGSRREHPDVDHDAQLTVLRAAFGRNVRVSDCLDVCEVSNVVVVNPSSAGRAAGGRPTWLGRVLSDSALDEVVAWVEAGGPGLAPLPASLQQHVRSVRRLLARTAR